MGKTEGKGNDDVFCTDLVKVIQGCLVDDDVKVPVNDVHNKRLKKSGKMGYDCVESCKLLKGINKLVEVESVFSVMENVVCVCTISPDDIETAHAKASGWANLIVQCNKSNIVVEFS